MESKSNALDLKKTKKFRTDAKLSKNGLVIIRYPSKKKPARETQAG